MNGKSQSQTMDSKTRLKKLVLEMFLTWSGDSGEETFGIGTWYSCFHCNGYFDVFVIKLYIFVAGFANSGENSITSLLGISPLTEECGFLALFSLSYTFF